MPKEVVRVECDLEGREDQWVEFRKKLKWKYLRQQIRFGTVAAQAAQMQEDGTPDAEVLAQLDAAFGGIEKMLGHAIVAWNWTDDDGEALPLPSEDPEVLGELYHEEVTWLTNATPGGGADAEESKNSAKP